MPLADRPYLQCLRKLPAPGAWLPPSRLSLIGIGPSSAKGKGRKGSAKKKKK